jgi:P4 family phage/plasmid primase-like protien
MQVYVENKTEFRYLTAQDLAELGASGLTDEQIQATGHFSIEDANQAYQLCSIRHRGLAFRYLDPTGIPYLDSLGRPFLRIKPRDWHSCQWNGDGEPPKYLTAKGEGNKPYFSPLLNWEGNKHVLRKHGWIETEGEKKADSTCAEGMATVGFAGVWGWLDRTSRLDETEEVPAPIYELAYDAEEANALLEQELETSRPLPELDWLPTGTGAPVYLGYDSDVTGRPQVQAALYARALYLKQQGNQPMLLLLPNESDGSKNGLDDFLVRHGADALRILKAYAKPAIKRDKKRWVLAIEPNTFYKILMAWSVLKEEWAYRPGAGWMHWQGTHWERSDIGAFDAALCKFMDAQGWQERGTGLKNTIVRELESRLRVPAVGWDSPDKIAFANGTYEFEKQEFTPGHDRRDRITKLLPYNWNPNACCPTWLRFLNDATGSDQQLIDLLQAWVRRVIVPLPPDRKADVEKSLDLFGPKGTGKGTFLDVLIALVGGTNAIGPASPRTFKDAEALSSLVGKRLAVDTDAFGFLDGVGEYNKVVSNEPVDLRVMYKGTSMQRLGVIVVRAYNSFIDVPSGSEGLDRRLCVVPFRNQPRTPDPLLSHKLQSELSGIVAWAFQISEEEMQKRLQASGNVAAVAEICSERFEANNPEYRFLLECYPSGAISIKAGELYNNYREWCKDNGHTAKSSVKFAPAIAALGCKKSATKNCGYWYYEIPKMSEFDVPRHLGIVSPQSGQLLSSCRDSLNPLPEPDRDSRDSLGLINNFSESSDDSDSQKIASLIKEVSPPTIPTVPIVELAVDSADSQLSPNCPQLSQPPEPSYPTENPCTPEISIDIVQAQSDPMNGWEECDEHKPYPNPKSDNIRSSQKRALSIRQAYRAATCKEELAALKNTNGGSYSQAELTWVLNWLQLFFPTEYQYVVATAKISQPSLFPE